MLKIKTGANTLKEIKGIRVKTATNALTKVAKGYQIVTVNGVPTLIPVFLSECKHNYVISGGQSWGASCTEDGCNIYVCSKCGDSYSEPGEAARGHNYVDGVCENCGDCLHHFEETTYVEVSQFYHSPACAHCGVVSEGILEEHSLDHYEYVGDGTIRVPVCICGFEFDPEPCEPEPCDWDSETGTCRGCGASCDHPETDDNGYCTTCGYCVSA